MEKYIDGEELYDFQLEVTYKEHAACRAAEDLAGTIIAPNDKSESKQILSSLLEIIHASKDIMKENGVRICAPHYKVEDGNYLPCYNMETRCSYCYKNKRRDEDG